MSTRIIHITSWGGRDMGSKTSWRRTRRDGNYDKIMALKKGFILDVSVLLHDPDCLNKFHGHGIIISMCAIEDMDRYKSRSDLFVGKNAIRVSNYIDSLRSNYGGSGLLHNGVRTASGGMLFVDSNGSDVSLLPSGLERNNDFRILCMAKAWQKTYPEPGFKVILVSKNPILRVKADACGITAQDYTSDKVVLRKDQLYTGYVELRLPAEASYLIDAIEILEPGGCIDIGKFGDLVDVSKLYPNHCCRIEADGKYILAIYKKAQGVFRKVAKPRSKNKSIPGVHPINDQQALAYGMMCDPDIKLITLVGIPGSGKTLISLLAGFKQPQYSRTSVFRPTHEASKEIGMLPGDIGGKMAPWKIPIIDAFNYILRRERQTRVDDTSVINGELIKPRKANKRDKKAKQTAASLPVKMTTAKHYMDADRLEVSPINYLRGRTFWDYEFVIVDEGQNFSPKESLFVITRAGEGCKMVIEGDTSQIDNPYVDATSCGLTYIAEDFKDEELTGHIILPKGERSQLANLAARKAER